MVHGDTTTSADHPLTLGMVQPGTGIGGTVDLTIASQGSEMATDTMRLTHAREMPVGGMEKEVKAGAKYLKMTNQMDRMLGGSPDKTMSSTGSVVASGEEEKRT